MYFITSNTALYALYVLTTINTALYTLYVLITSNTALYTLYVLITSNTTLYVLIINNAAISAHVGVLLIVQTYNLPKSWHFVLYVLAIAITSRTCTSHCHHQWNMHQSLPSLVVVEHVLVIAITSRTCTSHCHHQQNMTTMIMTSAEETTDHQ